MKTYIAVLKDDVVLNADIFNYLMDMEFEVLDYFPKLRILKLARKKPLNKGVIKYIKSIKAEKTLGV